MFQDSFKAHDTELHYVEVTEYLIDSAGNFIVVYT